MSALLFAPPLFFLLLCEGGVVGAARRIAICALVQVLAGLPFLLAHPVSYVRGAFDLGRIFMHRCAKTNTVQAAIFECSSGFQSLQNSRFW